MNDYGYKIWCGDYNIAKIVSDRLKKSGFIIDFVVPELLKDHTNISMYFGSSKPPYAPCRIYCSTSVLTFNKDDATEVRFNDLTTNFLKEVMKHERGI